MKGQDHALIAVDLGIGFPGVAGLLHRGYVGKADVAYALRADGKQHAVLKLLDAAVLLSDLYQILLPAFRIQIAGGHIEVLGRQDLADHFLGDHAGDIGFFQGLLSRFFKFRLGGVQLALAGYDLGAGLGKFAACCQLAAFQLLVAVLGGFQLLLQLRPHGRQGGLAGLDILQLGIDFRDSGLSVGNGAGQGIHGFL